LLAFAARKPDHPDHKIDGRSQPVRHAMMFSPTAILIGLEATRLLAPAADDSSPAQDYA
jgi:hypothetical protein